MSAAIRPFERRDRDQLTALVNLHVAAVIPGVAVSVNTVLSQLEREPQENLVDPWVSERRCLVAERHDGIVAAALLHRFRDEQDVSECYRGSGEIRWLVCAVTAAAEGARLLDAAIEQMRSWRVRVVGAECALPALACYGVPDTLPHLRNLLSGAGFRAPTRTEHVLVARCDQLLAPQLLGALVSRTLGLLGARLTLTRDGRELGFIEVCDQPADMARSSVAVRWADVGNLAVSEGADPELVVPALLAAGAEWLLLGGVERLVHYWAEGEDSPEELALLERAGFAVLVRNERGFRRSV